jgi:hypothetical protein
MRTSSILLVLFALTSGLIAADSTDAPPIRHSYLVLGGKTAIIGEDGKATWEYRGGTRDGFVLPNGNVLLAFADRVEEIIPPGQHLNRVAFSYKLSKENGEISTAQRLYNGNTLITELGKRPRLLEVNPKGDIVLDVPLQPETDNVHMQTRMARQLKSGNYLVPHLLAFAVKEYSPEGKVLHTLKTDLDELGGRKAENWPFTAIRLDNGNTLVSLTHGNRVVEFGQRGEVVWQVNNSHVGGKFADPCGSQRSGERQHRGRQPCGEQRHLHDRSDAGPQDRLDERSSARRRRASLPDSHHQRQTRAGHAAEVTLRRRVFRQGH